MLWVQAAYAIGCLGFGQLVDVIGVRIGYTVASTIWTLAHMAHGLVTTVTRFSLAVRVADRRGGEFP